MTMLSESRSHHPAGRPVTGRRVLAWMIAFFAVIFAANAVMIWLAVASFPGLEVSSSYRAGQEFNAEVAAAAAQAARGWNVEVHTERAAGTTRLLARFADKAGAPERGLVVTARLQHPTDSRHDRTVVLAETGQGGYEAALGGVAPGGWTLVVDAEADGARVFRSRNHVTLAD
jgi:nitrogen fixation protein FixH